MYSKPVGNSWWKLQSTSWWEGIPRQESIRKAHDSGWYYSKFLSCWVQFFCDVKWWLWRFPLIITKSQRPAVTQQKLKSNCRWQQKLFSVFFVSQLIIPRSDRRKFLSFSKNTNPPKKKFRNLSLTSSSVKRLILPETLSEIIQCANDDNMNLFLSRSICIRYRYFIVFVW